MQQPQWLQGAVIYQIYPRSFKDSNGAGVGNIRGIIDKLDYLGGSADSLGVTAIWLSPIYVSPMADFGYDVADYCDVDPVFGSIQDVKDLLLEAHKRDIKVILDFVPNHSSDEHPWFLESQSAVTNPKRDWYTWRDAKPDGSPPNNWLSVFGGPAWQLSEQTNQYYLHSFLAKQPDLNWDNPELRNAIKTAMRFWLDLGVDGFRVDAVDWMSKDPEFRDDPINPDAVGKISDQDHGYLRHKYSRDGPALFDRLNEMAEVLSNYQDRFMITEGHPESPDKISAYLQYYQSVNPLLSAPFNFEGIYLPWNAVTFRSFVDSFQAAMQPYYTPIYTLGNHDESRIATRVGTEAARTAAMLLLTLPGMAFVYYGDEIGMPDTQIDSKDLQDPFVGKGKGRDPQRTPMQWDDSPNAGFTTGHPWLPLSADYSELNVASELQSQDSFLILYKHLIKYRLQSPVIRFGDYKALDINRDIFAYIRSYNGKNILVILNFSDSEQPININDMAGVIKLSTSRSQTDKIFKGQLILHANEGLLIEVNGATND